MNNDLEWEKVLEWPQHEVQQPPSRSPTSYTSSPINNRSPSKSKTNIPEISGTPSSPAPASKNSLSKLKTLKNMQSSPKC